MSVLSFAFAGSRDEALAEFPGQALRHGGKAPFDDRGQSPCIPPAVLTGMMDRILLRARVERDNAAEECPPRMMVDDLFAFAVVPLLLFAALINNR
jgi:hypothetical protein